MSHQNRSHSECGASGAHRWMNCPGSVSLYRELPEAPISEAALRGTRIHEYFEKYIEQKIRYKLTGEEVEVKTSDTEEEILATHAWEVLYREVFDEAVTGKNVFFEKRLTLFEEFEMFGTVDLICIYIDNHGKRAAYIVDYKFGYVDVPIEDNLQIAFYACALYEESKKAGKPLDVINVAILQPSSKEYFKKDVLSKKKLENYITKFKKAASDIYIKKKQTFKVGDWCRYCRAQAICPLAKKTLIENSPLTVIDNFLPKVESIPIETLIGIYEKSDLIKGFLSNVEDHLRTLATLGNLPGYKMVEGSKRRSWRTDIDPLEIRETLGVNPYREELLPITTIEKIIPKDRKSALDKFLEVKTTKNKLVKENETGNTVLSVLTDITE